MKTRFLLGAFCLLVVSPVNAFEGRITAETTRGNQTVPLLYTVGADFVRVEVAGTQGPPTPVDIFDLKSDQLMLLFPQNRSYVRLTSLAENNQMKGGFRPIAVTPGPGAFPPPPGMPTIPAMPRQRAMPMQKLEFHATGRMTNILAFPCRQYELQRRGQTMGIWATDQLPPLKPYLRQQTHGGGPPTMEEPWSAWLADQKLCPLYVTVRGANGVDHLLFKLKSVTAAKMAGENAELFQPPADYLEIKPLPF